MVKRLTHAERKARTRSDLMASAMRLFLERGFHLASLDEIAAAAGYSKGAVYSNFENKEALFLAILDAHFEQRLALASRSIQQSPSLHEAVRVTARAIGLADREEPRWTTLLIEFWAHASRHEPLRQLVAVSRERFLAGIAELFGRLVAGHADQFLLPVESIVRGTVALQRGMSLERMLSPGSVSDEMYEQLVIAFLVGLIRPPGEAGTQKQKGEQHAKAVHTPRQVGRSGASRRRTAGA